MRVQQSENLCCPMENSSLQSNALPSSGSQLGRPSSSEEGHVLATAARNLVYVALICGAILSGAANAQRTQEQCLVPGQLRAMNPDKLNPEHLWANDTQYQILTLEAGTYLIRGDTIHLQPDLFRSLARGPSSTMTNVASITFDAREIVVDMPILVSDAQLRFFADTVRFTWNGLIGISSPPGHYEGSNAASGVHARVDQLVEIQTRNLDLSDARLTLFDFSTQDWSRSTDQPPWPETDTSRGGTRVIVVRAGTVVPSRWSSDVERSLLVEEPERYLHNLSQDRGRSAGFDWTIGYDVVVGPSGEASYEHLLETSLRWPDYTLQKLRRVYALDPYDAGMQEFIGSQVRQLAERMPASSALSTLVGLSRLSDLTELGQDLHGFKQDDVFMRDMKVQLDELANRLNMTLGPPGSLDTGLLSALDSQILASLETGAINEDAVSQLRATGRSAQSNLRSIEEQLAGVETDLALVSEAMSGLEDLVDQRLAQLIEEWQRKVDATKRTGEILEVLSLTSVAVSAVYPPAAPIALSINQSLETASALVCEDFKGDLSPTDALGFIEEARTRRKGYEAKLAESQSAFEQGNRSFNVLWDNVSQGEVEGLGHNLGEFYRDSQRYTAAMSQLYDQINRPKCTDSLEIPTFSDNAEILRLQHELSTLKAKASDYLNQMVSLMEEQRQVQSELLGNQLRLTELQALDLRNEADRVRSQELAYELRGELLSSLYSSAARLRRSFQYLGGGLRSLPAGIATLPDNYDPQLLPADELQDYESSRLAVALAENRSKVASLFWGFQQSLVESLSALSISHRGGTPDADRFTAQALDPFAPGWNPEFIESLNDSISFVLRGSDVRTSSTVQIPYRRVATGRPEFFVGAVVHSVTFSSDSPSLAGAREIEFEVSHSGFGQLHYGTTCLRAHSAYGQVMPVTPNSFFEDTQQEYWRDHLPTWTTFANLEEYAFPFDGIYYLTIRLPQPEMWPKAPRLEAISIDLVKRGYRD